MRNHTVTGIALALGLLSGSPLHARTADPPQGDRWAQISAAVAAPTAPKAEHEAAFSLSAIEAALRAYGMAFEKKVLPSGNVVYAMQLADLKFGLLAYGVEGDSARSLQLSAAFSDGGKAARSQKLDRCNRWNVGKRYVKAFVDGDNDIVLQMDLVAVGAIDPAEVVRTLRGTWMFGVIQFATTTI